MLNELVKLIQQKKLNKIIILGCPGAGKSTIATKLSEKINIPIYKMDDLYWTPKWKRLNKIEFTKILTQIMMKDRWLIDGNYAEFLNMRLAHAQLVIFINEKTHICIWRVVTRAIKRMFGNKESLPQQIRSTNTHTLNLKNSVKLFKKIIFFKYKIQPEMISKIKNSSIPFVLLNSDKLIMLKREI
jgi:uridine kinase